MTSNFNDIVGAADIRDRHVDDTSFDTDVFVVGTGPMGATAALALATYGVRTMMVSQWSWLANTPRAHITNQRAVEVLRDLGLEEEAKLYAVPWEKMGDTLFTTSLAGPEVARLQTWGTGDLRSGDYVKGSPCTMLDIPQTYMEPLLVKNAAERGAKVAFSTKYLGHQQDEEGVTVRLLNRTSGQEYSVRARYLIGADGAKSQVAEELGLEFVGHTARAGTAYVRFRADLSQYVQHRPSILHWIMNPAADFGEIGMGLLRCIRPWNEWIAGWGFDKDAGEPDLSHEKVLSQIRTLVGDPTLEPEIEGTSVWYVNQQHALTMSKGRVFCGGDATHRHPPSSGLGSNTCMQDAFNLAWKLAYVIKGHAGPELLESYSAERAPVGAQIVARANQSRLDYAPLRECFVTDAGNGTRTVEAGLARLRAATPEGAQLRAKMAEALELKDHEFNAQGVELNQRYASTAVVPDTKAGEEVFERDAELYLQATTRPGAKLPHAWLVDRSGRRTSTLDVTGHGRVTLVTGLSGKAWKEAASRLGLAFLRTVVVGEPGYEDPYAYWARIREVDEAGAILVRPDGYVAWRQSEAVWDPDEAEAQLREALGHVLSAPVADRVLSAH
ncbi:FAD-dependent monooxygenase [Sinomonas atrocyanea]|uniref:FAD-dependent monooxygenase n=1 Tax=Sinomonas atrocyanea TaxID=37927 RepID=UPI00278752CD|nr:FAD-dependent monooxygenase [Sinomonas atrocyanea]MDQ0259488.1 2,4-dichlorophenol 6-monooxygenase [Sinomonas atrocyanea]MDR6623370.1 2,4-dichlorophenol 6-monooxygenase [Sinomonas atrocyanea]